MDKIIFKFSQFGREDVECRRFENLDIPDCLDDFNFLEENYGVI